jgi:hypothetical protein
MNFESPLKTGRMLKMKACEAGTDVAGSGWICGVRSRVKGRAGCVRQGGVIRLDMPWRLGRWEFFG